MTDKAVLTNLIGGSLYRSAVQINTSSAGKSDFFIILSTKRENHRSERKQREIWDILFFSFLVFFFWVLVWKGRVTVFDLKEAFCFFPPSSLSFCWGFFVCFMIISIYSSAKGIDPTIWKIWSHGFSCSCSTGKSRKKRKILKKNLVLTPFVGMVKLDWCQNFK